MLGFPTALTFDLSWQITRKNPELQRRLKRCWRVGRFAVQMTRNPNEEAAGQELALRNPSFSHLNLLWCPRHVFMRGWWDPVDPMGPGDNPDGT